MLSLCQGFMRRALIFSGFVVCFGSVLLAQALFQKPVTVLGDPNFIGTASNPVAFDTLGPNWVEGKELNAPAGIALDTSVSPPIIYIADTGNNRVLGYRYATQLVAGSKADLVIGQLDFYSNQAQGPSNGRSTGLSSPTGLAVDHAGNLYVADTGNNRVLCFPQPFAPANSNQFPSLVIGQKTLTTNTVNLNGLGASTLATNGSGLGRTGIAFDPSGNLWVADTGNNRVLRFPAAVLVPGTIFPAADTVIGQATFTTNTASNARTNLTALAGPNGVSVDSGGNLYVTDQYYRALEYNAPLSTNQAAAAVLGIDQTNNSATTPTQYALNAPTGVLALNSGPIVADTGNNRLMVYSPKGNWTQPQISPLANAVVGQTSFTQNQANQGNGDASANSLNAPVDMAATAQELFVVDDANNRVLVFGLSPTGISGLAARVIGQLDFPYTGNNMVDGKGFSFPAQYPAQAVLDTTSSPPHLYVADTQNNRILGFKNFTNLQNGQPADLVIGQPDFNRAVTNYPSGNPNTPTASSLSLPTSLALDSAGNLYVTDTGNSRVLRFPAPYKSGSTALETADLVLGQAGFTSYITDPTSVTLATPVSLAFTGNGANAANTNSGWLVVADSAQNRVLLFQKPFTSGMSATLVLGQSSFNTKTAASTAAGLNSPRGVGVDPQDRILVADSGNARVQVFDVAGNLTNSATPLVSLPGFSLPLGIGVGPGGDFWVADYKANRISHFPSVPNLALTNDAADTALTVLAPHSAFVDPIQQPYRHRRN